MGCWLSSLRKPRSYTNFRLVFTGEWCTENQAILEEHEIKAATGKEVWSTSAIDRMLSNEKYIGQVLMQKTYTPDFLTGRQEKNDGALSMFLIENVHEAIIDKEAFMKVQQRIIALRPKCK